MDTDAGRPNPDTAWSVEQSLMKARRAVAAARRAQAETVAPGEEEVPPEFAEAFRRGFWEGRRRGYEECIAEVLEWGKPHEPIVAFFGATPDSSAGGTNEAGH